jgi:two-component system CheB/CheR fusion protein
MPKSADATGDVDHVLQVEDMPAMLMEYQNHLKTVQPKKDREGSRKDLSAYLPQIFAQLRTGLGHDFSHYKEKTLIRRVQRRMQVLKLDEPLEFINVLKNEPKELELLFQDLLISVTEFFRDAAAFQTLEEQRGR